MTAGHRSLFVVRGARDETRAGAERIVAALAPEEVLWVTLAESGGVPPRAVAGLLGRGFDAVVIDAHGGVDADLLGQCHGFVRGGGGLVMRLAPPGETPAAVALAVHPYGPTDVGRRFHERFERGLAGAEVSSAPLAVPRRSTVGNDEQRAVVGALSELLVAVRPACAVLMADRGRGKSAALGLALAEAKARVPALRVAVTAAQEGSVGEVQRFCEGVSFASPLELVHAPSDGLDVVVVDEAAQLPVPLLRALVRRHPRARFAFASTVRGYEGTGRGFALRFLPWLERERPVTRLSLAAPVRWSSNDPLERFVFDALLLDAEPAAVDDARPASLPAAPETSPSEADITAHRLDRDALAANETDLRALFGLLVHAHYRTTPSDLQRLLDAPNLAVHALRRRGAIVAACVVAHEGRLTDAMCDDLYRGRHRVRAHALADALVAHLGERDAGRLSMVRSVRIATHPALRRQGLARRLVAHVHASYQPDLFGTLFGATAELIAFRREVGYEAVRVSASRGTRTGEPAVMMLRPVSAPARELCARLRTSLARELDVQLALLSDELLLDDDLVAALHAGLPTPPPLSDRECDRLVRAYCEGPRTLESVATAARRFAARHPLALAALAPTDRGLIQGRVLDGRSWARVARDTGLAHPGVAMRAMRRAFAHLVAGSSRDAESSP